MDDKKLLYYKGTHAFFVARRGLKELVKIGFEKFLNEILNGIRKSENLSEGAFCDKCETVKIVPCPSIDICKTHCRKCTIHYGMQQFCRNGICVKFARAIAKWHCCGKPVFKHIDAKKWCNSWWEVAKCFMQWTGYSGLTSVDTADFSALVACVINCKFFKKRSLVQDISLYSKAREMRNSVFHKSEEKLTKEEVDEVIDAMIHMLSDSQEIQGIETVRRSLQELKQMKSKDVEETIDENIRLNLQMEYSATKNYFRRALMRHYEENMLTVPVCPGQPDEDSVCIESFYVHQSLSVLPDRPTEQELEEKKEKDRLNTHEDIFKKDGSYVKDVYISGPAGYGKTVLSQRMLLKWCNGCNDENASGDQFLSRFDFVFPIYLRNVYKVVTKVTDMVNEQILDELPEFRDFFDKVIQEKTMNCLFILDGLDEWFPPADYESGIPDRDRVKHCTFLTFSRPWKLESLRLPPRRSVKIITITELPKESWKFLIHKVVEYLNHRFDRRDKAEDFIRLLKCHKMEPPTRIPIILTQLVCLWSDRDTKDKKKLAKGNSQCQLYGMMVDFLLKVFRQKKESDGHHTAEYSWTLPELFKELKFCQKDVILLHYLCKLAFYASFESGQDLPLVFECNSTIENATIPEALKNDLVQSGLLSQSIIKRKASAKHRKLSFPHKSFQDFFLALYIATTITDEVAAKVIGICNTVEKVLAMEQMFVFLAGLNSDALAKVTRHIPEVINRHERTQIQRETLQRGLDDRNLLKSIQSMMLECLKECTANGMGSKDVKLICEDIYVDITNFDNPRLAVLVGMNKTHIKDILIHVPTREIQRTFPDSLKKRLIECTNLEYLSIYINRHFKARDAIKLISTSVDTLRCLHIYQKSIHQHASADFEWSDWKDLKMLQILKIKNITMHCSHVSKCVSMLEERSRDITNLDIHSLHCYNHHLNCPEQRTLDAKTFQRPEVVSVRDSSLTVLNQEQSDHNESSASIESMSQTDTKVSAELSTTRLSESLDRSSVLEQSGIDFVAAKSTEDNEDH